MQSADMRAEPAEVKDSQETVLPYALLRVSEVAGVCHKGTLP